MPPIFIHFLAMEPPLSFPFPEFGLILFDHRAVIDYRFIGISIIKQTLKYR